MADGFEVDIDKELAAFEAQERARLGLEDNRAQWTDSMIDPFFSAKERATVTILNGGLTMAHDEFVASALKGIGYNTRPMECADVDVAPARQRVRQQGAVQSHLLHGRKSRQRAFPPPR